MGDIGGFSTNENLLGLRDLTIHNTRFSIGLGMRYRIYEKVSVKFDLTWGYLHASDKKGSNEARDFEASTAVFEPSLKGEYYLLKNQSESLYRFSKGAGFFSSVLDMTDLYIYAGMAPVVYDVNPNEKLLPFMENEKGVAFVIPAGVGVNFLLTPSSLVGIDIGHRFTFNDYLDGYSSQYSKYNDRYYFMTIVFTHKLKTSVKGLPSFRR